ncbi:MAG: phosphoribosyltransferase [Myxococcaceae bacterium]
MLKLKRKAKRPAAKAAPTSSKKPKDAKTLRSIPPGIVLAPQAEAPREMLGMDRSGPKSRVRELTWAQFDRFVQSIAREVKAEFNPDAIVGVAHGGVFVGGAIASALKAEFFPVRISRRSRDNAHRATPRLYGEMPKELKGRRVLIVDDVAASGDTLELAVTLAQKVGCKQVRTLTLLSRPHGFKPDFSAVVTDDFHVFPWDYAEVTEDSRFDADPDKAGA